MTATTKEKPSKQLEIEREYLLPYVPKGVKNKDKKEEKCHFFMV